ncbi:MAG TPA: two-component system response regulator [Firmicutes bacterium]|nr:two-component system response regulator [Bacillota bacterium]
MVGKMAQGEQIMVVDDQFGIRLLLEEVLTHYGYHVISAKSGAEAVELVAQLEPDLVLLDMNMPGLSGPETLVELRQVRPHLPVVMVTADADGANWTRVEKLGVQGRISKPFDLHDLASIIERALTRI